MRLDNGPSANRQTVEFAGYSLDSRHRQLFDAEGNAIPLTSRAFDTLYFLSCHPGETVSKQQLMDAVWPNSVVEENNLSQAISALRKALGDNQRKHRIILTIPGRGYCFRPEVKAALATGPQPTVQAPEDAVAPSPPVRTSMASLRYAFTPAATWLSVLVGAVVLGSLFYSPQAPLEATVATLATAPATIAGQDAGQSAAQPAAQPPHTVQPLPDSIAVLPFEGINAFNDIFAQGLHDEVINQLSQVNDLHVIASASMRRYANTSMDMRAIADELRVGLILEGNIRMADDTVRINLRLFDPRSSRSLWTASYDAHLGDIGSLFALKADIAMKVAHAMGAEIQPQGELLTAIPTDSRNAYAAYLAGNSALIPGRYAEALKHFERAVTADPEYREALITLSLMHTLMTVVPEELTSQQHHAAALAIARQALALDPEDGYAHVALAVAQYNSGQWQRAADGFRLASDFGADIDKTTYHALFQMSLGEFAKARDILHRVLQIDPTSLSIRAFLMVAEEFLGNRDASLQLYASSDVIYPQWWGDTPGVWLALGHDDRAYLEKTRAEVPDYTLAEVLNVFDDPPQALARLRRIHDDRHNQLPAVLLNAAMFAAWYGENQMALELLSEGLAVNSVNLYVVWLPVFDDLRREAGFRQMLNDAGVAGFWRANGWTPVCEPTGNHDFTCNWQAFK